MTATYDLVIIGSGTAGLTAALFGARYGLRTLTLENLMPGGQIINAECINNFPGFVQGISGAEFGPMLQEQATAAGVEFGMANATTLRLEGPYHVVSTTNGDYTTKTVIVAAGSTLRKLDIPGEEHLFGRGVSQCATCDGPFFQDQVVAVVGGGDSALDEAEVLANFASQVILFHRGDTLRAQMVLQDRVLAKENVEIQWNKAAVEIPGEAGATGVRVRDTVTEETSLVDLNGVFVYIGLEPNTLFLQGVVALDNAGHISTNLWMATEVPGVFAAGDIRQHSAAQLVTAAGDGATAAIAAFRYIRERHWPG